MRTAIARGERFKLRLAADVARAAGVKAAQIAREDALRDTVDAAPAIVYLTDEEHEHYFGPAVEP